MTNSSIRMDSTQLNITANKPKYKAGSVCRKHLKYPDQTSARKAEGGLRCKNKYKQTLPNKPLISVITVVYNDQDTLLATIQSVLNQDYDNIEYIVIDGGSTDKTLDIIQSHESSIDYYISEPDDGIYSAMNKGISLAQGDYIGLLNSGDWYENNALSIIAENAQKQAGAVIAATQRTLNQQYLAVSTRGLRFMDERVFLRMPLSHPGAFIPHDVYEQVGNFAQSSYDIIADWDFIIRCYENKIIFYGIDDVIVNYWRVGVSAQGDSKIFEEQVALLHSRFPTLRNYDLLYLLSSNMDEKSDHEIINALQTHLNKGFVIPKTIMKGVYLYRKQKNEISYQKWLETFEKIENNDRLECINDEYCLISENASSENVSIDALIKQGQEENLHQQAIWLINERGWDAKDNGFAFYAWLKSNHPEINSYYVITNDSPDYAKVANIDPHTVIEYESDQHKLYYLFSKFVISSQGGHHCHPLRYERLKTHYPSIFKSQFVFLQHGVLKNYIQYFHKGRYNSSLLIISGEMEKQLFEQGYQYTADDLAITGLSRFDLLSHDKKSNQHVAERYIFMMPTWRTWIKNESSFLSSRYYKTLNKLLKSTELNKILKTQGFKLKLFIHPNFSQYATHLKSNLQSVDILKGSEDIGKLIKGCSFMITDYSSAIIDAAYMDKPIIYYQPDYQEFRASHYAETRFFSYKEHGLGSVVNTLEGLLNEITTVIDAGCKNNNKYQKRAKYLFAYRDNAANQRTHDAIVKHEALPQRLSQLYRSETLTKMAPFQVLNKGNVLYLFLASNEHTGLIVRNFTIHYNLMNGDTLSQAVNLPNSSMTLNIAGEVVYAFTTSIPDLTASIKILGNSYELPAPILANTPSQNITVAQLGFTITGGAGIAALRLHKGLLDSDVESYLFQKQRSKGTPPYRVYTFENGSNNAITDWNNQNNIYAGNTIFSLTSPSSHAKHKFLNAFDILDLHWVTKYLSLETVAWLSHLNKPIVWTLHDMNPLTGGCHYFHNCNHWQKGCENCPQLKDDFDGYPAKVLEAKKKYFNFKNITIVAISNHSKRIVEKSIFKNCRIEVIPNSLEIDIFKPTNKQQAKKQFGLPSHKKVICYFPSYASKVKGLIEAKIILNLLKEKSGEYHLLLGGTGSYQFECKGFSITKLGHIDDNEKLAAAFSAADVTIVPSLEETFSNTTAESLACGTPVVGFKVGGIPDMIIDGYNGYSVEAGDCHSFTERLKHVLDGKDLSANCRDYVEENLSLDIQANRYKKLYKDLLASSQAEGELANDMPEVFLDTALSLVKAKGNESTTRVKRLLSKPVVLANTSLKVVSTQLGVKIPARYNNSCFKQGWSLAESWGRFTDDEEAVIKLHLNDYKQGDAHAIFAVKEHTAINKHFSIFINGNQTTYEFKHGTLRFPVKVNEDKSLQIVFKLKKSESPFEDKDGAHEQKFGIGVTWFQITNESLSVDSESLQIGTKVFAAFDNAYFKDGWKVNALADERQIVEEEAIVELHLQDYERGKNRAIFAITHQQLINDSFTVYVNNISTDYEIKRGLLHFPIQVTECKNVSIVFKLKQSEALSEKAKNLNERTSGIGVKWFQVINPYKKIYVEEKLSKDHGLKMVIFGASVSTQGVHHQTGELRGYSEHFSNDYAPLLNIKDTIKVVHPGNRVSDAGLINIHDVVSQKPEICIVEPLIEDNSRGERITLEEVDYIYSTLISNNILPITLFLPDPKTKTEKNWPDYKIYNDYCMRRKTPVISNMILPDDSDSMFDGVHTKKKGGEFYAEFLFKKLKKILPKRQLILDNLVKNQPNPVPGFVISQITLPDNIHRVKHISFKLHCDNLPFSFKVLSPQKIGLHSPVLSTKVTTKDGKEIFLENKSVWDIYCHYSRESHVSLLSLKDVACEDIYLTFKVANTLPEYANCVRKIDKPSSTDDLYLDLIDSIKVISDQEISIEEVSIR